MNMRHAKKTIKKILTKSLIKRGYSSYFAPHIPKMMMDDFLQNKNMNFQQKMWAYRRGFLSSSARIYELNESNYKEHMPDLEYHKLHPFNGRYGSWIDDKLSMKYVLRPFNDILPKYYFQMEENEILRLMDCPDGLSPTIDGILSLLMKEGNLALKPYSGTRGEGFYRLSYCDGNYFINTKKSSLISVEDLLRTSSGYLVTEYVISHDSIKKIYDVTPNTLRIQMIRNKNQKPKLLGSFIRFGTSNSGTLETPLAGGILAGVDIGSGKIFGPQVFDNDHAQSLYYHPDTNEILEIQLPNWEYMIRKIHEILNYIPQLTYVGFDIVLTNEGFKILEINSLTSIHGIACNYPYFADEYAREYFTSKFQERPEQFQRILKQLQETDV